uniref:Uncharacterized protein n=1 Tax=Triticum urartu TaxID=4572 RepID=A0A8R7QRW0_TRIUA
MLLLLQGRRGGGRAVVAEVVERHHGRARRRAHRHAAAEAVVATARAEADHGPAARAGRAVGAGGDAGELLHHGAEVGGVGVEQRDGRPPRGAGPPPRRLADAAPLDPGRRPRGAPAARAPRRRARHRHHAALRRRGPIAADAVDARPVAHVRAGVAHGTQ